MYLDIWNNMIRDAKLIKGIDISDDQQKYLCQILNENLKNCSGFSFYIHEKRYLLYKVDLDEVKTIGDCALISAGLFPERLSRYGFDQNDFICLSQLAYFRLSYETNAGHQRNMYSELSRDINCLIDILWCMKKLHHYS